MLSPEQQERHRRAQARYRERNKEKIKEYASEYQQRTKGQAQRDYRMRNPDKYKATTFVNNRIRSKHWPRPGLFICSDCDQRAQHYHHEDYRLRWSVEPLCRVCHGKRHTIH